MIEKPLGVLSFYHSVKYQKIVKLRGVGVLGCFNKVFAYAATLTNNGFELTMALKSQSFSQLDKVHAILGKFYATQNSTY